LPYHISNNKFGYKWTSADSLFETLDSLLIIVAAGWIARMASKSYLKVVEK
jgi:hypothetical protein